MTSAREPSIAGRLGVRLLAALALAASAPSAIPAADCNQNGVEDAEDIAAGTSQDCDRDAIPDGCPVPRLRFAAGKGLRFQAAATDLATADLDRDGHVDVVAISWNANYLYVFQGDGRGNLAGPTAYPAIGSTSSLALGDLDGDGIPDAVATGGDSGDSVATLRGKGDGTFDRATRVPVVSRVHGARAGDLDGDGRADLAALSGGASYGNAVVLLSRGAAFAPEVAYPIRKSPARLVVADLDGDGALDLAATNRESSDLSVLLNRGDGSFLAATTHHAFGTPYGLACGDLDGDGIADLATANPASSTLSVLLGEGGGAFAEATTRDLPAEGDWGIHLADLDGDGRAEVVAAGIPVFSGLRDGTLRSTGFPAIGGFAASAVADMDEDGRLDLVQAAGAGSYGLVAVQLNRSTPGPAPDCDGNGVPDSCDIASGAAADADGNGIPDACEAPPPSFPDCDRDGAPDPEEIAAGSEDDCNSNGVPDSCEVAPARRIFRAPEAHPVPGDPFDLAIADLDGDGAPDVAVAHRNGRSAVLWGPIGDSRETHEFQREAETVAVALGDLDRDGLGDAVLAGGSAGLSIYLGRAGREFAPPIDLQPPHYPIDLFVLDVDRDEIPDIVTTDQWGWTDGYAVGVLLGNGDASFRPPVARRVGEVGRLGVGDVTGDGVADIAFAGIDGHVQLLAGNGDGSFAEAADLVGFLGGRFAAVGDLDGDGTGELVVTGGAHEMSAAAIFHRIESGEIAIGRVLPIRGSVGCPLVGDVDGDGRCDLAVPLFDADTIELRYGLDGGGLSAPVSIAVGGSPTAIWATDLDGDAVVDLATANSGSRTISVLPGRAGQGFLGPTVLPEGVEYDPPGAMEVADFDGDGAVDVAVHAHVRLVVYLGDGAGSFRVVEEQLRPQYEAMLASGDLDGDGIVDLLLGDFRLHRGLGNGRFVEGPELGLEELDRRYVSAVRIADLDGDGRDDLVVAGGDGVTVLIATGPGRFVTLDDPYSLGATAHGLAIADLDSDGTPDIAAPSGDDDAVLVLLGRGGGLFDPSSVSSGADRARVVAAADIDGNGTIDLLLSGQESSAVTALPGRGDGTFGAAMGVSCGGEPESLIAEDLDGDGATDLAVAVRQPMALAVIRGLGAGAFEPDPSLLSVSHGPIDLAAADVDGDGRRDVVALTADGEYGAGSVVAVLNESIRPAADSNADGVPDACTGPRQLPGDCDQDGALGVSDAICTLGALFLGQPRLYPCGDGSPSDPSNLALLDWHGDGRIDISDGIASLRFLFLGDAPHVLGVPGEPRSCVAAPGCPDVPACGGPGAPGPRP